MVLCCHVENKEEGPPAVTCLAAPAHSQQLADSGTQPGAARQQGRGEVGGDWGTKGMGNWEKVGS